MDDRIVNGRNGKILILLKTTKDRKSWSVIITLFLKRHVSKKKKEKEEECCKLH